MRTFIAIELTRECREVLGRVQERLRRAGAGVSWVRPENIHLTLVFLEDVDVARIPLLVEVVDEVARTTPSFDWGVESVGFFGASRSPRVIWAGVTDPSGRLAILQRGLAEAVRSRGFPLEDRPFHPHVTLGRVRSSRGAGALTSSLASASVDPYGSVPVTNVHLFQSRLDPAGPKYTILHSATLKGEP